MKTVLVVGSGAGGAAVARELQGPVQVTVIEAGGRFRPQSMALSTMARLKRTGLVSPPRVSLYFPPMRITAAEEMILVRGRAVGGTTTLSTGNAIRADASLRAIGIDLDDEFRRLEHEVTIGTQHQARWSPATRVLWRAFEEAGLDPEPMPKAGEYDRCSLCGRCILGCPRGVKWDSRRFLSTALARGARLRTGWCVTSVDILRGEARGVWARRGMIRRFFPADAVVLAAGGLGTPAILQSSGLAAPGRLWVDPVLCVAGVKAGANQCRELPMPFFSRQPGFMLSPYFDLLSFLFHPRWQASAGEIVGVMIKLADTPGGTLHGSRAEPRLSPFDLQRLEEGAATCSEILERAGILRRHQFRGLLNAGHPGGMVPLTVDDAVTLRPAGLPANLYVSDASLLPTSLGAPPILTIMALSLRIAARIEVELATGRRPTASGEASRAVSRPGSGLTIAP